MARLTFDAFEAMADSQWEDGIDQYRGGDPSRPFDGDAAAEGISEGLDARNYARQLYEEEGRLTGPEYQRAVALAFELACIFDGARPKG
ncbi:MAG: hypothetical protein ACQGVC_17060 [Myxococcota bacterium]